MFKKIALVTVVFVVAFSGLMLYASKHQGDIVLRTTSGETFLVVLESNPTSKHYWKYGFDDGFVELLGVEYVPGSLATAGEGGTENFKFRVLKFGESQLTFSYLSEDSGIKPEKVVSYKVISE